MYHYNIKYNLYCIFKMRYNLRLILNLKLNINENNINSNFRFGTLPVVC